MSRAICATTPRRRAVHTSTPGPRPRLTTAPSGRSRQRAARGSFLSSWEAMPQLSRLTTFPTTSMSAPRLHLNKRPLRCVAAAPVVDKGASTSPRLILATSRSSFKTVLLPIKALLSNLCATLVLRRRLSKVYYASCSFPQVHVLVGLDGTLCHYLVVAIYNGESKSISH